MKQNIMLKLMLRDIRRNFLQYLSMIIITMLAVNLFCGFVSNTLTLDKSVEAFFQESNLTDLTAQFSSITISDYAYFDSLKERGEITDYEPRFYAEGIFGQKSGKIYGGSNTISAPIITDGAAGVLIANALKNDGDDAFEDSYAIGDMIEVELAGFPALSLEITGFMYFAEAATFTYYPVYIDINTLCAEIFAQTGIQVLPFSIYNQILVKTTNPTQVSDKINAIDAQNSGGLVFVYGRDAIESIAALNGEVLTSRRMIYIFPVIFLLVSVLVIMTTSGALILRERTNIGTLKALGISDGRIILHYALFGAALCFIGGMIGAIAAPLIVPRVMLIKYALVYCMPPVGAISVSMLWSAIAVLGVCALALGIGLSVCRGVIKERPAECMRPAPPRDSFLLRRSAPKPDGATAGKKGNLPLKMAIRNIIIKPARALMTVAGVTGCTALLVCSFGIGNTVNNSVNLELGGQFKYNLATVYAESVADDFLNLINGLQIDGTIDRYETYSTYYMTARSGDVVKSIKVFELNPESSFTTIRPSGGALISKAIADEMQIRRGDTVGLATGAIYYELEITEIIETAATKGIFVDAPIFAGSYRSLGMWIAAAETQELLDLVKENNGTGEAYGMNERRETVLKMVSSIDMIKLTMTVFSIALSVVVLYNLSLLNVKERNRSIATLKVLGFSSAEVALSLLYEIMLLVALGTLLGLFLGFPILYMVMSINRIEIIAFIYHIKPASYALSALLSLMTAAVINVIFGAVINKIKMIDSLKSVE